MLAIEPIISCKQNNPKKTHTNTLRYTTLGNITKIINVRGDIKCFITLLKYKVTLCIERLIFYLILRYVLTELDM